ncbi:MAG: GntR family transcriptional regulator [Pirellulales bacterium]
MAVNRKNKNSASAAATRSTPRFSGDGNSAARQANAAGSEGNGEQTLVDGVYEQILLQIIQAKIGSGQELKSTVLAKELGVSRTPVVQALQRLAADGIVNLELNKRAVVRPGAENWLVEVHQLRELLEPAAAALAAQLVPDEHLAKLRELAAAAADRTKPGWSDAVRKFDFALHLTIADHTGNLAPARSHSQMLELQTAFVLGGRRSTWCAGQGLRRASGNRPGVGIPRLANRVCRDAFPLTLRRRDAPGTAHRVATIVESTPASQPRRHLRIHLVASTISRSRPPHPTSAAFSRWEKSSRLRFLIEHHHG